MNPTLPTLFRSLAAAAAVCVVAAAQPASAFELVSSTEAKADRAAPESPTERLLADPDAPKIDLLSPTLGKPLRAPLDIQLRWSAAEGAAIDPASVRVKYGRLGLDVTQRVLGAAKVGAAGISAPGAQLPAGEHRLTVEVTDSQQRVGKRQFSVEVIE